MGQLHFSELAPARGNAKKENLSWIETLELDCVKKACAILGDWGPDEEGGNDVSAAVSFFLSLSLSRRQTHTQTEDRARFITIVTQQQHQQQQKIPSLPNAECRSQRIYLLALCLSSSPSLLSLLLSVSTRFRILCCRCSTPTLYVVCCHHPRSTVCCNKSHSLHMTTDTCEMQYLPDACTIIVRSMFSNPTYATLPERGKGCDATELRLLSCLCECQCVCCLHVWPSHPYGHGPSELCLYLADIVGGTTGANS